MAEGWTPVPEAALANAMPVEARPPRRLQNAAGLLLVGGCLSAFVASQILIGGPMFLTILPDGSATDSTLEDGSPAPGAEIIPREVVFAWAALGIVLALGATAAFLASAKARRGEAHKAYPWALAASLLPPLNPVTLAGAVLARRSMWPAAVDPPTGPGDAATSGKAQPSGLLRTGGWLILAGSAMSAVGAVASAVAVVLQLAHVAALVPVGEEAPGVFIAIVGGLAVASAGGTVFGVIAWRHARRGLAQPAAGWGFLASLCPPFNFVLMLGAILAIASPEGQGPRPVGPALQLP